MIYYLSILLVCLFVSLFYKAKTVSCIIAGIILIVFAGTRLNVDNDYEMYRKYFSINFNTLKSFNEMIPSTEYSILLINKLGKLFFFSSQNAAYFGIFAFAFLGVTSKMVAIRKYSTNIILSIVLYSTYLFLMQEMTTIRAGVSSGIFLICTKFLVDKKYMNFLFFISISFLFHNSSILFIFAALLIFLDLKIKYYYYALLVSFLIIIFNQNIMRLLFLDLIFPRVAIYLELLEWSKESKVNIFNFKVIISLFFFLIFALNYTKFNNDRWFEVLFRINILSLIIFFAMSNSAVVFSTRSFELLSVVQILLFPMLLKIMNNKLKIFGWILIISVSIVQIYYLIDFAEIYKPYESWLFKL